MPDKRIIKTSGEEFDNFLKKIGKKLKSYRKGMGYSNAENFSFDHHIGRAQYSKYEKGTEDMRISTLHRILKEMSVSWEEFFKDF